MLAAVSGTLDAIGADWVVINLGNVSLQVSVPTSTLADIGRVGERVKLHTHLVVKEDNLALYGFASPKDLRLFQQLLSVNGVGPRTALAVLSVASAEALALAIISEDSAVLSRAPGVGKKTASRIILELKGRLEKEWPVVAPAAASTDGEVLAALQALGYSLAEAKGAMGALEEAEQEMSLEERLRLVLSKLGR